MEVQFDTKPLLRPQQVAEAKNEIKAMEEKLKSPHIEDKGEVAKQLRRVRESFEKQVPREPTSGEEEGRMVARSQQLLNEILVGMPSQEEMRKAPPGAVDKHTGWEQRNKSKILEWKNLQLRLKPGEREAANLERHRPVSSSLNMDNAVIPGKMFFLPPAGAAAPVTFSEEQIAALRQLDPKLADMLCTLPNEARAEVKKIVGIGLTTSVASIHGKAGAEKKKRVMTEAHKAKLKAGKEAAAEKRKAA